MIRAVLDTNIVVSALILEGSTNRLANLWRQGKFSLVVSKAVISEYLRVFAYPKFELSVREIQYLITEELLPFTDSVEVKEVVKIVKEDPADNQFLACAKAGKCDYIVSGDHHLLALKRYEKTAILSAKQFLALFEV